MEDNGSVATQTNAKPEQLYGSVNQPTPLDRKSFCRLPLNLSEVAQAWCGEDFILDSTSRVNIELFSYFLLWTVGGNCLDVLCNGWFTDECFLPFSREWGSEELKQNWLPGYPPLAQNYPPLAQNSKGGQEANLPNSPIEEIWICANVWER